MVCGAAWPDSRSGQSSHLPNCWCDEISCHNPAEPGDSRFPPTMLSHHGEVYPLKPRAKISSLSLKLLLSGIFFFMVVKNVSNPGPYQENKGERRKAGDSPPLKKRQSCTQFPDQAQTANRRKKGCSGSFDVKERGQHTATLHLFSL